MKKSISFSLEADIIQKITMYQAQNNLSNRSQALERIILSLDIDNIKPQPQQLPAAAAPSAADIAAAIAIIKNLSSADIKTEKTAPIEIKTELPQVTKPKEIAKPASNIDMILNQTLNSKK